MDEICPIASKDKAIAKAKLIPLVFFRRHGSATSASSASLRPFGVPCITVHGFIADAVAFGETGRLGGSEIRRRGADARDG